MRNTTQPSGNVAECTEVGLWWCMNL